MRQGKQTFVYQHAPVVASHASIVGPKEGEGPLASEFDEILPDDLLGQKSWELAESEMLRRCILRAAEDGGITLEQAQALFSGDLNNQIIATGFAARALGIPFFGLYGACSTFVEALVLGSALISGGFLENALCSASSHFCTAERQFRMPLEMGTQRPPSAHWTATAAGCALLKSCGNSSEKLLRVTAGTFGKIEDYQIKDANHMGAAMAPAVCSTICAHFEDMRIDPDHYDLVATGDLGWIGREILLELLRQNGHPIPPEKLVDCGASLYYQEQDTHAGGSGCGCVASVGCSWIMKRLERGEIHRALLVGSGAMLSPTSTLQAQSIPGIAYAAALEVF